MLHPDPHLALVYGRHREDINTVRKMRYAMKKAGRVELNRTPTKPRTQHTDEEERIRKSQANREYYAKNKSTIMARRKAGLSSRRGGGSNGSKEPIIGRQGIPEWQTSINLLSAEVQGALGEKSALEYCRDITEICLSRSSLEPLTSGPSSSFEALLWKTDEMRREFQWRYHKASSKHQPQLEEIRNKVQTIYSLLRDIECYGLLGMRDLRKAYVDKELDFQKLPTVS